MTDVQLNLRPVYDRREFEKELQLYMRMLGAFGRTLTGSPEAAEDLAQDTVAKALASWKSYTPGTNLKAWLFMIMRNHFYSEKRRSWRESQLDSEAAERTLVDPNLDPEEELSFVQEFSAIAPLLAFLPSEQSDALLAVKYCGMPYERASLVLGIAVGTVKSRVSRAITSMQRMIGKEDRMFPDISAWAHASEGVPRGHSYLPIAKAYEEIHFFLAVKSNRDSAPEVQELTEEERLWRELRDSDGLNAEEDLFELMRSRDPY
jgi:RNA polymerase sigma-70 factor, ECF subfamily